MRVGGMSPPRERACDFAGCFMDAHDQNMSVQMPVAIPGPSNPGLAEGQFYVVRDGISRATTSRAPNAVRLQPATLMRLCVATLPDHLRKLG